MISIPELIRWVSSFSVLIPIILLIIVPYKSSAINILGIALLVAFASDMGSLFLLFFKLSSTPLANFYTLIEFILISLIFQKLFFKKRIVYIVILLFTLFFIIDSLYIEGVNNFQSYTTTTESIIFIIYSVAYYIYLYKAVPHPSNDILKFSPAWINAAIFFYFSFDLFFFIVSKYVFTKMPRELHMTFWSFHNLCNILKNVLFAIGIYYARHKKTEEKQKILRYDLD